MAGGNTVENCDLQGAFSSSDTTSVGINSGGNPWTALTPYTSASFTVPTFANADGYSFKETVASCTSGASEPTWILPTGAATPTPTTSDGTCSWIIFSTTKLTIKGNIIEGFGSQGFNSGCDNTAGVIEYNEFRNMNKEGILLACRTQRFHVSHNWIHHNGGNGFDNNGSYNLIDNNQVDHNGGTGASAIDQDGLILFCLNGGVCVGNAYRDNVSAFNNTHGIRWQNSGTGIMSNNIATGNVFYCNGLGTTTLNVNPTCGSGGNGDGFRWDVTAGTGTSSNNLVTANVSVLNSGNGVYAHNTATAETVTGNLFSPNSNNQNTSNPYLQDSGSGIGASALYGSLCAIYLSSTPCPTNVPVTFVGLGDQTAFISQTNSSGAAGLSVCNQFSTSVINNAFCMDGSTGDWVYYDSRFPGTAGTERLRIKRATGLLSGQTYNSTGTSNGVWHIVQDTATLVAGTITITLTGNSVFANATSYTCVADDDTAIAATHVLQNSGSSITITGTSTDVVRYICVGD